MQSDIFARRIVGPFRHASDARQAAESVAVHYRALRRRGLTATRAFRRALQLPATYLPGYAEGYGKPGSVMGAPWQSGRTTLRWCESTAAIGLRFVGWADELPGGPDHTGWYTRDGDEWETLRGGVWQLPTRHGEGRLVYGYAEFEGGAEMNTGSAALVIGDVIREGFANREREPVKDWDATRDAASWADCVASYAAERQRDDNRAYDSGNLAAQRAESAAELRGEALALCRDLRAFQADMRKLHGKGANALPAVCKAIERDLRDKLDSIRRKRAKRLEAWADCPAELEESFRAGYCDTAGVDGWNRFARLLGLARFAGSPGDGTLTVS